MGNFIVIRGGGDIASGTIAKLFNCGFKVIVLEKPEPTAIRRHVCFSEAAYDGSSTIEGINCLLAKDALNAKDIASSGSVAMLLEAKCESLKCIRPSILIDAILAKKNLGTNRGMAQITIALGPGFSAGVDVDAVIETMRGHDLGRIIYNGNALPNTGCPGIINGIGIQRVLYSPCYGRVKSLCNIGSYVEKGQAIALISDTPVLATIDGYLRGLIRDGITINQGTKLGDIDPRTDQPLNFQSISDKARCIAGGVLEAIFALGGKI